MRYINVRPYLLSDSYSFNAKLLTDRQTPGIS